MPNESPTVQDRIKHEEELINRRLTWMLVFQGFLFNATANATQPDAADAAKQLVALIPWVGCASAFLGLVGVAAAYLAIDNARKPAPTMQENFGDLGFPRFLGRLNGGGLPILLCISWLYYALNR